MAVFCTDAGHGGRDSGAVWQNTREKDLNLLATETLNQLLRARGHTVYTTRRTDNGVPPLGTRCRLVNAHHKQAAPEFDLIVSLHCNVAVYKAEGAYQPIPDRRGFYAIYSAESTASHTAAGKIATCCANADIILSHNGLLSTVELGRTLAWIHKTLPPAVLLEMGFMSNGEDLTLLKSEDYRQKMLTAVVEGIEQFITVRRDR